MFLVGHFEFHACPISPGEVPTQACFDSNPLTFVEDLSYGANPDPNYPERAYIPNAGVGSWNYRHRYQLPAGLTGDLVLIQVSLSQLCKFLYILFHPLILASSQPVVLRDRKLVLGCWI